MVPEVRVCLFLFAAHHHITLNSHSHTNDFNFLLSFLYLLQPLAPTSNNINIPLRDSGFVIHTKLQSWQQRAKQKTPIIQDVSSTPLDRTATSVMKRACRMRSGPVFVNSIFLILGIIREWFPQNYREHTSMCGDSRGKIQMLLVSQNQERSFMG